MRVDAARKILASPVTITSKLTAKAQTTIPHAVRTALGLRAGDELAYVIEDGRAVLTRFDRRQSAKDPFASFAEWHSDADRIAVLSAKVLRQ